MNNFDAYVPIDIHGPIKTSARLNIQKYNNNNPVILFQLFDGPKPLMLDDISKVAIAFTNTNNVSVSGSGTLQVVNPHRGTISYELSSADLTMSGLITITLGITTGNAFFTVQTVAQCQDMSSSLLDALNGDGDGSGSSSSSFTLSWDYGNNFPCQYFNIYCRLCRRCKWAWENNTLPKPVCFNDIKMCKNPFIYPPAQNFANMEGYEEAHIPTALNEAGDLIISIDGDIYTCDIGKDGAIYLMDKSIDTPTAMIGLYLGPKLITYYKTSERVTTDNFSIDDLFNGG